MKYDPGLTVSFSFSIQFCCLSELRWAKKHLFEAYWGPASPFFMSDCPVTLVIQYISRQPAISLTSQHRVDVINSKPIQLLKWLHVVCSKSKMPKGAFVGSNIHFQQKSSSYVNKQQTHVWECAAGSITQTFPVCAVGDLQGVDALSDLLVGGFLGDHWAFELTLWSVQGF